MPGSAAASAIPSGTVIAVRTSGDLKERLTPQPNLQFTRAAPRGAPVIHVDDRTRYQRITGFGGALTDSSAWLIDTRLHGAARSALFDALFGPSGIDMSFLRIPMGATDFTVHRAPYSYDDLPRGASDPNLSHFSIAHDEAYIIPALHEVLARNPRIAFLANPWSVPGWMKTNGTLDNQHHSGVLGSSAAGAFALYFVKFLQAYAAAGIRIGAITPQNEPGNPTIYPGMELPANLEAHLIGAYLKPALSAAGLHPHIYGNDQGWSPQGVSYSAALGSSPDRRAIWGFAWHCYYGSPLVMAAQHAARPQWDEIVDECATGIIHFPVSEVLISSVREWASVVTLFNLAEDTRGGPVQPPNHGCSGCTPLATIDSRTNSYRFDRSYYQLGQMSKFVRPGAQRIASENFVSYAYTRPGVNFYGPGLDDVALRNPDGSIVLVAYNNGRAPITFTVAWRGRSFGYTLAPQSTVTFLWNGG